MKLKLERYEAFLISPGEFHRERQEAVDIRSKFQWRHLDVHPVIGSHQMNLEHTQRGEKKTVNQSELKERWKKINDREDISSYGFLYSIGYIVILRSLCVAWAAM